LKEKVKDFYEFAFPHFESGKIIPLIRKLPRGESRQQQDPGRGEKLENQRTR
jgi:hypothetical protein